MSTFKPLNDFLPTCRIPNAVIKQVSPPLPRLRHAPCPFPPFYHHPDTSCSFLSHLSRPQIRPKNRIWSKIYPKKSTSLWLVCLPAPCVALKTICFRHLEITITGDWTGNQWLTEPVSWPLSYSNLKIVVKLFITIKSLLPKISAIQISIFKPLNIYLWYLIHIPISNLRQISRKKG